MKVFGKYLFGALGTLILGAIGSGIWEILFRPGLSRVGSFIVSISGKANEAVYQNAALDPTPIASLFLLLLTIYIPMIFAMWFLYKGFFSLKKRNNKFVIYDSKKLEKAKISLKIVAISGFIFNIIIFSFSVYAFSLENKSVLVWRTFHKNAEICNQYLSVTEQEQVLASFRKMKNRADFDLIATKLSKIASAHKIYLEWGDAL